MRSQTAQLIKDFAFCLDGTAPVSHIIGRLFQFRVDIGRDGVRTVYPRRHPNGKDMFSVNLLNGRARHIVRLKHIVVVNHLALDVVDFGKRQAGDGSHGHTIDGFYSDKDISSTNVLNIVGKRTDRAVDGGRVPAFLELDAVGFNLALLEQIIDVGE